MSQKSMKTNNKKYHIEFDIEFLTHKYPGKLIAIEGIDGSGKTTQAKILCGELEKKGHKVLCTKEPTDEPTGKFTRQALSKEIDVPAVAIQYLYGADRAVHQIELVKYLKLGYYIITDRYFWSSVAYGTSDMDTVDNYFLVAFSMLSFYNRFLKPDITFYLKVSPKVGEKRIEEMAKKKEIYENTEKLNKIVKGYDFLLKKFPREFILINGEQTVGKVTKDILNFL